MIRSRSVSLLFGLGLIAMLTASVVLAVPGYSLSASPSIDVPDQTITYQDNEFTVRSVTRVTDGESVSIHADVPDDATYEINFRGPENQLISSERLSGDTTHTIDYFGEGKAGTYAVTIRDENERKAVYPVILSGYDVSVDAPQTVETGQSITVETTLTEREIEKHSSLDSVEVVVGDDEVAVRQQMSQEGDGQYTATISTADIDPATYNLYVVVRGDESVRQRAEILAISDLSSLTISEKSTETRTDTPTESEPTPGDKTPTEVSDPTPTPTEATATPTETKPTPTAEPTPPPTTIPTTQSPTEVNSPTPTMTTVNPRTTTNQTKQSDETTRVPTETTGTEDVLNPAAQSTESSPGESGPGFTVVTSLLAILLLWSFRLNRIQK